MDTDELVQPPPLPSPPEFQQQEQQYQQHEHEHQQPPSSYHSLSYAYQTYLKHDTEEQNHWEDVCGSYRQYANFAMAQWANHQYRLHALPEQQRSMLPEGLRRDTSEFHRRSASYKDAAIRNQFCLDCILRHAGQPHSQEVLGQLQQQQQKTNLGPGQQVVLNKMPTDAQMSKVSSVLKSLVRDWSTEGRPERDMAYAPILEQLRTHVPISTTTTTTTTTNGVNDALPRVCVPGAGVGRLALEISALGYAVQGNEFSLYMLLASDFILNGGIATPAAPIHISPWLLETRNVHQWHDPLRSIQIPDVDPYTMVTTTPTNCSSKEEGQDDHQKGGEEDVNGKDNDRDKNSNGDEMLQATSAATTTTTAAASEQQHTTAHKDFSMAAGEFVSIYGTDRERSRWDAVVACFFLDASPSIVQYLQVIHQMLKPGGILINFGPLLWHWSGPCMRPEDTIEDYVDRYSYLDKKYLTSVDLCWEDIREILVNVGFEIVDASSGQRALYTADRRSMMNMDYRCVSFVARKKGKAGAAGECVLVQPSSSSSSSLSVDEQQQQQLQQQQQQEQQQQKQAVSDEGSMTS